MVLLLTRNVNWQQCVNCDGFWISQSSIKFVRKFSCIAVQVGTISKMRLITGIV